MITVRTKHRPQPHSRRQAPGRHAGLSPSREVARAAVFLLLLTAAGCTQVLHTDFDSEGGPWPPGSLAGPPPGDSAEVQGDVLGLGDSISLQSDSSASIDLITGGQPHNTSGYAIDFAGIKPTISETPVLAIDALDPEGQNACGLEISDGEFRLVSGDGESVIGEYTANADEHRVFLRLNLGSGSCGVRIEQFEQGAGPDAPPTVPLITATGPLITQGFEELDRLRFAWENTAGTSPTQYFLGHVTISRDD